MGLLYDQLRPHLPVSQTVNNLIESVQQLPGLEKWSLPETSVQLWPKLLQWGLSIWTTRNIPGTEEIRNKLGTEILTTGEPKFATLAELDGAALCIFLGAVAAGKIPEGKERTADWRMVWPNEYNIDVEVTSAEHKQEHVLRKKAAKDLTEVLFQEYGFDVIVDIVNPTLKSDCEAIVDYISEMKAGDVREVSGHWRVRTEEKRGTNVIWIGGQDQPPDWWGNDMARSCVFQQMITVKDAVTTPSQIQIWFGLPYQSYINPICRKAESPQGTKGLPFLIAFDVANLPSALSKISKSLDGWFGLWKSVSGILIFHRFCDFHRVGWTWQIISNPSATIKLSEHIIPKGANISILNDSYININENNL